VALGLKVAFKAHYHTSQISKHLQHDCFISRMEGTMKSASLLGLQVAAHFLSACATLHQIHSL